MSDIPLRADARQNRGRILDAAEEVFGRGGEGASTEDVARLAGVGIATVFRHFPTKAALLEEVLVRRFTRLCDRAATLAEADDPGAAFVELFRHVVADAPGKIAIGEATEAAGGSGDRAGAVAAQYRKHVATLLRRAQTAGAIRTDVGPKEVQALIVAASRSALLTHLDAKARDRLVRVVLDGLSATQRPRSPRE
jgi:AcrR family transcriptional regulator